MNATKGLNITTKADVCLLCASYDMSWFEFVLLFKLVKKLHKMGKNYIRT